MAFDTVLLKFLVSTRDLEIGQVVIEFTDLLKADRSVAGRT